MKKRLVSMVVAFTMILSLAPAFGIDAFASTSTVTSASDWQIEYMLNNIAYQNFSGSASNVEQAKAAMRHFMFDSDFAAIGGGTFNYPNSGAYTYHVSDGTYSKDIRGSTGCCAYSYFVSDVVYGTEADNSKLYLSNFGYSAAGLKTMLTRYAQAGEHLRADNTHSVAFISGDDNGFYCFSYNGDRNPYIRLDYWTYADYINYYSGYTIFLYNANPADNADNQCAYGHNYGSYSVTSAPTESSGGRITACCTRCGAENNITLPAFNASDYDYRPLSLSTCTTGSTARYTWKNTQHGTFYFDVAVPAWGHSFSYAVEQEPTEHNSGYIKGTCTKCGYTTTIELPPLNGTDYSYAVLGEVTCAQGCIGHYTWNNTQYGSFSFDIQFPALEHKFFKNELITAPTENTEGLIRGNCDICGTTVDIVLPRLNERDYSCEVAGGANCTKGLALRYTWNVEEYGKVSFEKVLSPAEHSFENGVCTVCGAKSSEFQMENPFTDVSSTAVYYDAVMWAYYHAPKQITGGFDATHFVPDNPCTRAQVVTFLWRAAGCPEPEDFFGSFLDVCPIQANGKENPYYKAILWASEIGITSGVDATHFAPDDPCTRAQFVTFLWRYSGKQISTADISDFADAATIANAYRSAVAWAVENGVTTGYNDGTFRPNDTCTRWAVLLFMYRALA